MLEMIQYCYYYHCASDENGKERCVKRTLSWATVHIDNTFLGARNCSHTAICMLVSNILSKQSVKAKELIPTALKCGIEQQLAIVSRMYTHQFHYYLDWI